MSRASYSYWNVGLICQCGFAMNCSMVHLPKHGNQVEYRARCTNSNCKNYGTLFRVGDLAKIPLVPIKDPDA